MSKKHKRKERLNKDIDSNTNNNNVSNNPILNNTTLQMLGLDNIDMGNLTGLFDSMGQDGFDLNSLNSIFNTDSKHQSSKDFTSDFNILSNGINEIEKSNDTTNVTNDSSATNTVDITNLMSMLAGGGKQDNDNTKVDRNINNTSTSFDNSVNNSNKIISFDDNNTSKAINSEIIKKNFSLNPLENFNMEDLALILEDIPINNNKENNKVSNKIFNNKKYEDNIVMLKAIKVLVDGERERFLNKVIEMCENGEINY